MSAICSKIDPALPRDLLQRRKNAGYAAICAVGFAEDETVFRLATAENVEGHLPQLQPGRWEVLHFVRLVWTPGLAVARTIVLERVLIAAGMHLGQHWYRTALGDLDALLAAGAAKLRSPTWSQAALAARLRHAADREADRFAAGDF